MPPGGVFADGKASGGTWQWAVLVYSLLSCLLIPPAHLVASKLFCAGAAAVSGFFHLLSREPCDGIAVAPNYICRVPEIPK